MSSSNAAATSADELKLDSTTLTEEPKSTTVVSNSPAMPPVPTVAVGAATTASLIESTFPRLMDELIKFPIVHTSHMSYGTAGFRCDASLLQSTCHRMGMLATLRARQTEKIVGLMITASHNMEADNGLKIVDSSGGMLTPAWEPYCTELANASDEKEAVAVLNHIIARERIDLERTGNIFIAKDTRSSSEHLSELAREGALLLGGNVLDFSLQTTPQLHHLVRMWNHEGYNKGDWASEAGYYHMLIDGFKQVLTSGKSLQAKKTMSGENDKTSSSANSLSMEHAAASSSSNSSSIDPLTLCNSPLVVDAAHGVGAIQLDKLMKEWPESLGNALSLEVRNTPSDGPLNVACGAEHCQKAKRPPSGFSPQADVLKRCVSIDGDADRLVYHYFDVTEKWHLLDGDKIATLFALFFIAHAAVLKECGLSFGIVQTAYANGASTSFLKSLGCEVKVAKTGVKYCHELATSTFDIALYFEANGHGTVIYNDASVEALGKQLVPTSERSATSSASGGVNSSASATSILSDEQKKQGVMALLGAYQLLNQSVGDAFSDVLMVEAVLLLKGWSIADWDAIYTDVPSRQTKVSVASRTAFVTDSSETTVLSPVGCQVAINKAVKALEDPMARAFARPSGTEDYVRIYAEASTAVLADELARQVATIVWAEAGEVGDAPTEFLA